MIKLENVSKFYYSASGVTCALRKINLEFKIGEYVAITGESGSGKTTLLNILSGLDSYEEGEMYIRDKQTSFFDDDDWEKYRRDEIAFIFQDYNLINSFTVLENAIVPLIISGYSYQEATLKIKEILKLVGLEKDCHKKAIKLSGGQKQRLAIARSLAKDTKIIVADEPTGNLDAENGKAIMKLLKKISQDKLVIVVTHNQEQAEPYITRKVRLHDGEVVSDEIIEKIKPEVVDNNVALKKMKKKGVFNFSFLNIKSQPKKSILLLFLVLLSALSTFVFIGTFSSNLDDAKTKMLDKTFFENFDETRMLVKPNSEELTAEVLERAKVARVTSVEKYDYITDINYFLEDDYHIVYNSYQDDNTGELIDLSSLLLDDRSNFLRSTSSLSSDMLKSGTLPTGPLQMVVYSEDESVIGTTQTVLFSNSKKWSVDAYLRYEVTICGILKDETSQVYFSEDICKVMDFTRNNLNINLFYTYTLENGRVTEGNIYKYYIAIDYSLKGNEISFPESNFQELKNLLKTDLYETSGIFNLPLSYRIDIDDFTFNLKEASKIGNYVIGVSEELFTRLYDQAPKTNQFVVFVEDYAYVDSVINELYEKDFQAVSCYRTSVTGYDSEKLIQRYITLAMSVVFLVLINLVTILIGYSILKLKKNDYLIFKIIGLTNNDSKKVNYLEVFIYAFISSLIVVLVSLIIKEYVVNDYIIEFYKYIRFYHYIIAISINFLSMFILGRKYGKFISQQVKVTQLRED